MPSHTSVPLTHSPPMLSSTPVMLTCRVEGREGGVGGEGQRVRRVGEEQGRATPGGRRDGGWKGWPQLAPGRPKQSVQGLVFARLLQQAAAHATPFSPTSTRNCLQSPASTAPSPMNHSPHRGHIVCRESHQGVHHARHLHGGAIGAVAPLAGHRQAQLVLSALHHLR